MKIKRLMIHSIMAIAFLSGAGHAVAATISVGTPIVVTADTIAVPIEISDAVNVISWQFNLTYDPTDLQVNTSCDPFSGDAYCSLLTGPVTEGDFFSSGAPFNLLIPGFVDLDSATLAQTGLLFGVHGAFGGVPPFPSGADVLAYVEFRVLGDGTSPIVVDGTVVSVPEPGTLLLMTLGIALSGVRRLKGRRARV